MLAVDGDVVAACRVILDEDARLVEIVPEPRSTSVVHAPGVVGPEWL
jgi:hypothetical protein